VVAHKRGAKASLDYCDGVFAPLSSLTFGWGAVSRKTRKHSLVDTNSPTTSFLVVNFFVRKGDNK